MTRRAKTIVVLAFELCVLGGLFASFGYFVVFSRDFLAHKAGQAEASIATDSTSP